MERHVLSCLFQIPFCLSLCYPDFPTGFMSIGLYEYRSARLTSMFGDKQGSHSLKVSKRKLQNRYHWTHKLTNYSWNWRALYFKMMIVRYCRTIKGFNYIFCSLFNQKENHVPIKSQVIIFSQTCSFPRNPNLDNDTTIMYYPSHLLHYWSLSHVDSTTQISFESVCCFLSSVPLQRFGSSSPLSCTTFQTQDFLADPIYLQRLPLQSILYTRLSFQNTNMIISLF